MFELTGKRAVITGAASGIGFAIGQMFASQGANVVLIDLDLERLNFAENAIREKTGALVSGFTCDVGSEVSVGRTFAEIAEPIDLLVNCAGLAHVGNLQSTFEGRCAFDDAFRGQGLSGAGNSMQLPINQKGSGAEIS